MFPHVKFVTSKKDLEDMSHPTSIANCVMNELKIQLEDWLAWWRTYKVAVTDGIANKRSHITMRMKNFITHKFVKIQLLIM